MPPKGRVMPGAESTPSRCPIFQSAVRLTVTTCKARLGLWCCGRTRGIKTMHPSHCFNPQADRYLVPQSCGYWGTAVAIFDKVLQALGGDSGRRDSDE